MYLDCPSFDYNVCVSGHVKSMNVYWVTKEVETTNELVGLNLCDMVDTILNQVKKINIQVNEVKQKKK